MKLTWRLSLAVSLGVFVLLVGHAFVRVGRDVARYRDGVRAAHRTLGLATAAALRRAAEQGASPADLDALVNEIDDNEPSISLRWVRVGDAVDGTDAPHFPVDRAAGAGATDTVTVPLPSGIDEIVSHVIVALPDRPLTAVEIVEPLTRQAETEWEAILRTASATAVVVALCVTLILGFGVLFVGRPLEALRRHASSIGRGERGARTEVRSADEIGELASEMNAMAQALDAARERAQREEVHRLEALAQLRHADRLRAVGELASSLAHDLGAPMNAVNARAHMIASGEVDEVRARELAARIVAEIERMSHSIRQLLDHGRREAPTRAPTDLVVLVASATDLVQPIALKRGVELVVQSAGDVPEVRVDPGQLRHVILNLVSNAIDAAPRGTRVEVHVERGPRHVTVRVGDRGPGIAEEHLTRVFEPFFTTKPEGVGTGLGLSVARAIVAEHGGQVVARRLEPNGTELAMTLPVDTA